MIARSSRAIPAADTNVAMVMTVAGSSSTWADRGEPDPKVR
jgi:hypothetical protein